MQNIDMWKYGLLFKLLFTGIIMSLLAYAYYNLSQALPPWHTGGLVVAIAQDSTLSDEEFAKQLAHQFADSLHVQLKIILVPADQIETTLQKGHAHFSASGFKLDETNNALTFGPGFMTVHEQVAFNQDQPQPRQLRDLIGSTIAVIAGSNQEKTLLELKKQIPELTWESRTDQTVEDLLKEVGQGKLDYTLANHEQISEMLNYYVNLAVAFDIGKPSKLAWAFPEKADNDLMTATAKFFTDIEKNGELQILLDRYYGHNDRLAPLDAAEFINQTDKTLSKFKSLFKEAGKLIDEDWRLIAAIAYQESHWDPLATSDSNVRGMMMLTEATAARMNVTNRLDPRESIMAGAKYLELIKKQLPVRIEEPERTWLALAAYNQGYGHLEDARILTRRQGGNTDTWVDIKKWMPSLNKPVYFESLKHGYARGGEAVIFVENIRAYYDMLSRLTDNEPGLPQTHTYQLISTRKKPAFALHALREPTSESKATDTSYSLAR